MANPGRQWISKCWTSMPQEKLTTHTAHFIRHVPYPVALRRLSLTVGTATTVFSFTLWGRYRYKTATQGYIASGDLLASKSPPPKFGHARNTLMQYVTSPNSYKHHRCALLVWTNKPSVICLRCNRAHATLQLVAQTWHTIQIGQWAQWTIWGVQISDDWGNWRGSTHLWEIQTNLPSHRLVLNRHRILALPKTLPLPQLNPSAAAQVGK